MQTDFKKKLYAAPMAGFTDAPMRRLLFSHGCDISVSEMVSAKAMCLGDEKTGALAAITEGEGDTVIQLFGHEPDVMARAAEMVAAGEFKGCSFAKKPVAIDINMGCPVKKIVSSGDGSALMKDPRLAGEIVLACVKSTEKYNMPITVKIRAGWDKNSINAPMMARILAECGASAITVHGRTREQMYAPSVDLSVIRDVRCALPEGFPLIGNCDITCGEDALEMMKQTGCDSVMIGRGLLGNPWVFEEIKALQQGRAYMPPSLEERVECALSLAFELVREKGEETGVREARGRVAHFIKGLKGAAALRDTINRATTLIEVEKAVIEGLL